MLWGTDWPHSGEAQKPDDALLLDQTARWIPDAALRRAMLVTNPARALLGALTADCREDRWQTRRRYGRRNHERS